MSAHRANVIPVLTYNSKEYKGMILVHPSDIAQFKKGNLPEEVNGGTVGGTWARRNRVKKSATKPT